MHRCIHCGRPTFGLSPDHEVVCAIVRRIRTPEIREMLFDLWGAEEAPPIKGPRPTRPEARRFVAGGN